MVVDRRNRKIGAIIAVGQTRNGRPAALVESNGSHFKIENRELRLKADGDEAVIGLGPSELRTRAILNAG